MQERPDRIRDDLADPVHRRDLRRRGGLQRVHRQKLHRQQFGRFFSEVRDRKRIQKPGQTAFFTRLDLLAEIGDHFIPDPIQFGDL